MEDKDIIQAMNKAYDYEVFRMRRNVAPKPWNSYAEWVHHDAMAAVLAVVRELDKPETQR